MSLKQDLATNIAVILDQEWDIREGRTVPDTDDVALAGGGVKLDATILYADLEQSSKLATEFQKRTAAKVIRVFLSCMCKLIAFHNGAITSFDGDRVMGVFVGDSKNTTAAKCALQMNWVMLKLIRPMVTGYFKSLQQDEFQINHCVGIDTGEVLVVRAGQRGDNDLVWIGRPANLAAKLSDIREDGYNTFISGETYRLLHESSKYGGDPKQEMWESRLWTFLGEKISVYRSGWWWPIGD